jgi:hypothetical protein
VKKRINLFSVLMFLIVLAALGAKFKGIDVGLRTYGFSSGG